MNTKPFLAFLALSASAFFAPSASAEGAERYVILPLTRVGHGVRPDYAYALPAMLAERLDGCLNMAPVHGPEIFTKGSPGITADSLEQARAIARGKKARWIIYGDIAGGDSALTVRWRLALVDKGDAAAVSMNAAGERRGLTAIVTTFAAAVLDRTGAENCQLTDSNVRDPYAIVLFGRGLRAFMAPRAKTGPDPATVALESAVNVDPNFAEARRYLGYVLERRAEPRRAREQYQRVLEKAPTDYWALRGLAFVERDRGNAVASEAYAARALVRHPADNDLRLLHGDALWSLGRPDDARLEYELVAERDPANMRALKALVVVYAAKRSAESLTRTLEAIVGYDPRDTTSALDLAASYLSGNEIEKAIAVYEKVLAGNDPNVPVRKVLGDLYRSQGQFDRALAAYRRAGELSSDDPRFPMLIAGTLASTDDLAGARTLYARIASGASIYRSAAQRNLAVIDWRRGEKDPARRLVGQLMAKQPDDASLSYLFGLMAGHDGRWEEARKAFGQAVFRDPEGVGVLATPFVNANESTLLPQPGIDDVFWPADRFRQDVDRYLKLAADGERSRVEFDLAVARTYAAVTDHRRQNRGSKSGCPAELIGPHFAAAEMQGKKALALSRELERLYERISDLNGRGEGITLTPEYRTVFAGKDRQGHRNARNFVALRDGARRAAIENGYVFRSRLEPEVRALGCQPAQLAAAAAKDAPPNDGRVWTYPSPYQPPAAIDVDTGDDDLSSSTVFFSVDNGDCGKVQKVFVDGRSVGAVGNDAAKSRLGVFEVRGGPHDICVMPDADDAKCALPANRRHVFVHEGWSLTVHCR